MRRFAKTMRWRYRPLVVAGFALIVTLLLLDSLTHTVYAQPLPPPGAGYLDFSFGLDAVHPARTPTEAKPESKLWWNDGFWWGSLWNQTVDQYHIYRLNWGTQVWEDTGVPLDDRLNSKADTLWDADTNKLYVASHYAYQNSSVIGNPANYARLYRYSYNGVTHTYTLDSGFPVAINHDKTEALTIAKDSNGRLWITYVSRDVADDPNFYKVYVNTTTGPNNDASWGEPLALTDLSNPGDFATEARVALDDIAAIIAFKDNGGDKVGIMWSSQYTGTNHLNFAWHLDSNSSYGQGSDWTLQPGLNLLANTTPDSRANDHMNLKALRTSSAGQVFAAIKFDNQNFDPPQPTAPQIGLLARDVDGVFTYRKYSSVTDNDSRPLLVLDEGDPANTNDTQAHLFVSGLPEGSRICYKSLAIPAEPASLTTLGQFPSGNCGVSFIADASGVYNTFRDPTSTKQNVNMTTGLVVLASDVNGRMYAHNAIGNPPPVLTAFGPSGVAITITTVVTATFSKPMDSTTLNASSFKVLDGVTPVAGVFSYNNSTRTATFTPNTPLKANTTYTVQLTNDLKDYTGLLLDGFKATTPNTVVEQWTFVTGVTSVQFALSSYSVLENGGQAVISVTLASPASQPVSVDYATSDGAAPSATAGQDYTTTTGTLVFNPGETVKTFVVPIKDDISTEGNETVNLALANPLNANLGLPPTASLTIIDNEGQITLQFTPASYVVNENDPTHHTLVNVTLNQPSAAPVKVNYATSNGTATAGQDYTAISGTLTFAPGQLSQTFAVPITDDLIREADETISLTLSSPVSATLGTPGNVATVTIKDDDPAPTVQFSSATFITTEGSVGVVMVKLSSPSAFPVTVAYATNDNTAKAPGDYTSSSGILTFAPGVTSQTFNVTTVNDTLNEDNETVKLVLSNATNAVLGGQSNALLTILDNDPLPTVQFSTAAYSAAENAGQALVTVRLSTVSGRGVQVHYSTSDGTATAGADYVASDDNVLIPPGQITATFPVGIVNDTVTEPSETVNLTLDSPVNATLGARSKATVVIADTSSAPVVQFSSANYKVGEGGGTAVITVSLTSASTSPVTVQYATSNGTATAGQDYTSASGALTFAAGQLTQTFTVPILQDKVYEGNETVNLTLSTPVNATLGAQANAVLTINDDEIGVYLPLIYR
ncbi:MAG: Calx-beta domain-containing protein [Caldilineaceae bacterium]